MSEQSYTPVFVAGNRTVHAGRRIGQYESGTPRYAKLCASNGRANHEPSPAPDAPITCKLCLARMAKDAPRAEQSTPATTPATPEQATPAGRPDGDAPHGYVVRFFPRAGRWDFATTPARVQWVRGYNASRTLIDRTVRELHSGKGPYQLSHSSGVESGVEYVNFPAGRFEVSRCEPSTGNVYGPDRAPATPATPAGSDARAEQLAQLAAEVRHLDEQSARMTAAQYAELCHMAARAELAAARRAGLNLPREVYAEQLAELTAAAALAGLERAAMIDAQQLAPEVLAEQRAQLARTSAGPRWAAVYATHSAPAGSPVEWSELHGSQRAQLMRARWAAWLRNAVRRELAARAELHAAESGEPAAIEQSAEELRAARQANGEQLAEQLAQRLARAGSPLGALEVHAIAAALAPMTHAQRAEVLGSTPEACKTYAAKGRAALRRRFPSVAELRATLHAADLAADRADLYSAAILRTAAGHYNDPSAVLPMVAQLAREERAEQRAEHRASTARNVEHWAAGHAGGVIREMPTSATPEDGVGQLSRVESASRGHVGYVVHRGVDAGPYQRAGLHMAALAHRARVARAQRIAHRAQLAGRQAAQLRRAQWLAEQRA